MSGLTTTQTVHFHTGRHSQKQLKAGLQPAPKPDRLPRITKLMALAIKFEGMIQDGIVTDYADLARLGGVTRARMTQIMNLLTLAPDIQEAILFLPPITSGRDPLTERELREVVKELNWNRQREAWASIEPAVMPRPLRD